MAKKKENRIYIAHYYCYYCDLGEPKKVLDAIPFITAEDNTTKAFIKFMKNRFDKKITEEDIEVIAPLINIDNEKGENFELSIAKPKFTLLVD